VKLEKESIKQENLVKRDIDKFEKYIQSLKTKIKDFGHQRSFY